MVKLKWHTWGVLILVAISYGIILASAIIGPSIWMATFVVGAVSMILFFYYLRRHRKRRPRYPLVPPEARPDVYLPRTDIPRPIHEDIRRMEEKKRQLEKLRKMRRKKKN